MLELKRTDGSLIARTRHKSVRRQVEAHWAILRGADLRGAYLTRANLTRANLSGANLTRADLTRADLRGASLYEANLRGASLYKADLCGASLYKADLCGVSLQGIPSAEWLSKWRGVNLLPAFEDGGVLVWKHVRLDSKRIMGNLGFEYQIDEQFECACMACAGPWGAVREVSDHRQTAHWAEMAHNPAPHLLAIHAAPGALYDYAPAKGVYYAFRGTPVSLYRVTDVDADGFIPHLVAGEDVLGMIEGEEGVRDGTGDARH